MVCCVHLAAAPLTLTFLMFALLFFCPSDFVVCVTFFAASSILFCTVSKSSCELVPFSSSVFLYSTVASSLSGLQTCLFLLSLLTKILWDIHKDPPPQRPDVEPPTASPFPNFSQRNVPLAWIRP